MGGAIPYFGDAYMADTRHLTLEEHGAYHLLLLIAWRSPNCALPNDDKRIAQMLGITPKKWAKLKPVVLSFWTPTENGWEQKRLTKERRWVEEKSRKNSAAAGAKWEAKRLKDKAAGDASADANGQASAHANGNAPLPPPTQEGEPNGSLVNGAAVAEPDLLPEHVVEAWNETAERCGLPLVKKLTRERLQRLRARIRENSLDDFKAALASIERSPFLKGESSSGWRADFDFFCQKSSFTKLIEGSYDH